MRKITFTLLFFCLTITTVFAQATIDIATPNSNGFSDNQVADFDVDSDGTILNNSASDGTAQLGGTAITANPNITADSEATLILFQVTSISNTSDLKGAIEVFGTTAGVIIANPYRITCNGCGFINTNKVGIVVGTANLSGTDLTDFSISTNGNSRITVNNSGFADDAIVDELNLVARDIRIQSQTKANNTLRVLTGNDTYDHTTDIITSNTTESTKHSININVNGSLEADNIELIGTEISSNHGVLNAGGDISADSLKIDFNGLFRNQDDGGDNLGNINISGLLEVINAENFINNSNITAEILSITTNEFFNNHNGGTQLGDIVVTETFSLSIPSQTSYTNTGTVSSDSLDLTIGGDFAHDGSSLNNFAFNNFAITTMGNYSYSDPTNPTSRYVIPMGSSLRVFGDANIQVYYFSNNNIVNVDGELDIDADTTVRNQNSGTISTDSLVIESNSIINQNDGKITANNATITLSGTIPFFRNSSAKNFDIKNNLDIFTPTFENSGNITVGNILRIARDNANAGITVFENDYSNGHGTINADTFNLFINNDFDYVTGYRSNGTITDSALNLNVAGNFSYDNANSFIWAASDSLTVAGNANIDARTGDYTQNGGTVDVAGTLTVSVRNIEVENGSTINVGGTLSVSATSSFTPRSGATISVDTFDFNAAVFKNQAKFTANDGTINIGGTNSQFLNNSGGEFNINNSLDIITTGVFENHSGGDISAGDTLTITLTNTTESFVNHLSSETGNISTNTFNLSVAGDFDYEDDYLNNGTITTNSFNLQVGGDFISDDSTNNFTWGAQNSLTVLGNADITTNNYTQNGAIDVTGIWTISAEGNYIYNSPSDDLTWGVQNSLTVLGNANITVNNYTQNGAIDVTGALTINANNYTYNSPSDDFTWNANDSLNVSGNADITTNNYTQNGAIDVTGALAISAVGDFTNFTAGSINAATLAITVGEGTIDNDGTITTTSSLTIDTDAIHNSGSITTNTFLTINATNDVFSGGSIETSALAIDAGRNFGISGTITTDSLNITAGNTALNTGTIVSGSLDITTDDFFRNLAGGDISVDSLNITAGGKVTNIATINAGTLNIIANNNSSRTNDTTGFYVSNRGDITVTDLIKITAVDNFYNTGNLTANTLAIEAKDILLLNTDSIEPYDGGDIVLSGDSSFIADGGDGVDGGIIVNRGNIDLGSNNLDVSADRFINHADANVTADTLNLNVSSFVNDGTIDATINQ